ncbi:hypothetical protein VNI00_015169 [Paramarasmius palmivorus]|uniref:F-box domain-containing protein n=1 Tax=Paramarasmius palmivorus TaxID=297713 RepID=A0AAW0BPR3_9AGAR
MPGGRTLEGSIPHELIEFIPYYNDYPSFLKLKFGDVSKLYPVETTLHLIRTWNSIPKGKESDSWITKMITIFNKDKEGVVKIDKWWKDTKTQRAKAFQDRQTVAVNIISAYALQETRALVIPQTGDILAQYKPKDSYHDVTFKFAEDISKRSLHIGKLCNSFSDDTPNYMVFVEYVQCKTCTVKKDSIQVLSWATALIHPEDHELCSISPEIFDKVQQKAGSIKYWKARRPDAEDLRWFCCRFCDFRSTLSNVTQHLKLQHFKDTIASNDWLFSPLVAFSTICPRPLKIDSISSLSYTFTSYSYNTMAATIPSYLSDNLPAETLSEIFTHLTPYDLIMTSGTCHKLKGFLENPSNAFIWRRTLQAVEAPSKIPSMAEHKFAALLYLNQCRLCHTTAVEIPFFSARMRCCSSCLSTNYIDIQELKAYKIPERLYTTIPHVKLLKDLKRWSKDDVVYYKPAVIRLQKDYQSIVAGDMRAWIDGKLAVYAHEEESMLQCDEWWIQTSTLRNIVKEERIKDLGTLIRQCEESDTSLHVYPPAQTLIETPYLLHVNCLPAYYGSSIQLFQRYNLSKIIHTINFHGQQKAIQVYKSTPLYHSGDTIDMAALTNPAFLLNCQRPNCQRTHKAYTFPAILGHYCQVESESKTEWYQSYGISDHLFTASNYLRTRSTKLSWMRNVDPKDCSPNMVFQFWVECQKCTETSGKHYLLTWGKAVSQETFTSLTLY